MSTFAAIRSIGSEASTYGAPVTEASDPVDPGSRSVRDFIVLDRTSVILAAVLVLVLHLAVIQEDGVFILYPFLVLHAVLLTIAKRAVDQGSLTSALAIVAGSNWIVAIAVTVLFPWILAVMVVTVLMPLVLALPYVDRHDLGWFLAAGALTLGLIGAIGISNDDGGVLDDVDDTVELAVVVVGLVGHSIPVGLVVRESNQSFRRAAEEATELGRQVNESRRRLVTAADTERSRIERDLHDGAQQRLVAVGLQLRRLSSRRQRGDDVAAADIDTAVAEVEAAMTELRALAHGIYPPLLELRGLPEALTAVARRSQSPVELHVADVGRYDRTVESTVYFCCTEALQNVDKHAPGARVHISLEHQAGRGLTLRVSDDGAGFDAAATRGSRGLVNMADRVGSAGGTLTVESEPGQGTTIAAQFPGAAQRDPDVEANT